MAFNSIQNGFSAGEMSPRLFGRTDLAKYHIGCSTMRNFFADYRGGASSRAGFAYVGMCKQGAPNAGGTSTDNPPRDIPFQFNINQGYALEFGDVYMRIKSAGAYVIESTIAITAITNASPGVFTYASTGYTLSNGQWIFIEDVGGMTNFNGLTWIVAGVSGSNFHVTDLFGNVIDTTAFSAYTSGGTLARIYTVVSPYNAVDLPFLKFTQSADTMTLTCVNQDTDTEYPSYELVRNGPTNWTFTADSFASSISAPTGITVTAHNSTTVSTYYSYVVTAVDATTGEESIASSAGAVQNNDIAINAGSNTITWNAVTNASSYNVYAAVPSYSVAVPTGAAFGYIGSSFGTQFTDTNIVADFTVVPPVHDNPFAPGAILSVTPTAIGASYTQVSVGYSISTSTGSGAVITPVVVNGGVVAYIVDNGGSSYLSTDTISITGTTAGAKQANGFYLFDQGNPTNGQTIILNGVTWTFVSSGSSGNQTDIQSTTVNTVNQLQTDLTASSNGSISVASYGSPSNKLTITYKTAGTSGNTYTLSAGTYGGSLSGAVLTGGSAGTVNGATANLVVGPNIGVYPATCAYFQQRRVYAFTLNRPDTYFMSQPGAFSNMDSAIPATASDAITGAPWAQQINGIQFLVAMPGGLVILTGKGAWQLNGGNAVAITPADQTATPQSYNGCNNHIPPIVVNYDILYVQSKGSIVRDLSYNFFVNIYTGTDMTVLSNHLFDFHQLQQWAYAEEPFKIVWAVRDDGILLALTYLKEQDVYAWSRHDTNGLVVGVCSITEPPVDAVYTIIKRYIQGENAWAYYSERMDNRNWQTVEDCFCVDAGLTLPMTFPDAVLTPAATDGTDNISSLNLIAGGTGYTAPTISATDPTGQGSGFAATLSITNGVITGYSISAQGTDYQPGTQMQILDSTGSGAVIAPLITNNVIFTTDSSVFTAANVGDVIRVGHSNASPSSNFAITPNGGGRAIITTYTSGTQVTANIVSPITNVIPDDPNDTPVPVSSNYWSLATPVSSVSGLNHLEGMEVAILADGSVVANQTVTDGAIDLPASYSAVTVGLPFTAQLQSLYLDAPSQQTMQGKRKNIQAVTVRVQNTRGISVGTNQVDASTQPNGVAPAWTKLFPMKQRNPTQFPGAPIPLFTGDLRELVGGDWQKPGQIAIQITDPVPGNILALLPEFNVGDVSG